MAVRIMELAPFRLRPGVTEEQLVEASAALQRDFVSKLPGFLSRTLLRATDGSYLDVVWWASREAAQGAVNAAAESKTCAAFFALMDADVSDAGAGVDLFTEVAKYPA